MPKITKLERQKHMNSRVSVFVDQEYAFSLTDETVVKYGLFVGADVNNFPLEEICESDRYRQALSCAFVYLSHSAKSEKQLHDYLFKKEFDENTIDRIIERLKELNYIDDFLFAQNFAENSMSSGVNAIRFKLKSKGISDEIINSVLEEISDDDQLSKALEIAKKQILKYSKYEIFEQKRKLNDFLYRKGFQWDIIKSTIEKVFSEEN